MAHALCLTHVPFEGPGVFQACLVERGYQVRTCLVPTEGLPENPSEFLLVMGGPMSVNDPDPWVTQEIEFILTALSKNIPVLGVCLGAQLLARALGASVAPGSEFEIGMASITLTEAGQLDPAFAGMPKNMEVFQWHGEGFDLPSGAVPLAFSSHYQVQAFRAGTKVYGLLFHLEMEEQGVVALCRECPEDVKRGGISVETIQSAAAKSFPSLHECADVLIGHLTAT